MQHEKKLVANWVNVGQFKYEIPLQCQKKSIYIYIYIYTHIDILQCTQYIPNETLKVRVYVYYNYIITACEVVSSNAL